MKMAEKRAYVGAVLMATNTSDFFSQDLEDLPREVLEKPAPKSTPMTGTVTTPGDFIITGVKGEHYPCKPDIFALTYEEVV